MSKCLTCCLALLFLLGCANETSDKSSYNKGVQAYRDKNYELARKHWTQSVSEDEEDEALNNLGYLLYYGLGGSADPDGAVALWQEGATRGVSEAQWHLGIALEEGKGVEKNHALSYAWLSCAVANGERAGAKDASAEKEIANDARKSLAMLAGKISAGNLQLGRRLAEEYIAKYGQPVKRKG